jgi:hypothetical protein
VEDVPAEPHGRNFGHRLPCGPDDKLSATVCLGDPAALTASPDLLSVTDHPTVVWIGQWIGQQIMEAFPWDEAPDWVIRPRCSLRPCCQTVPCDDAKDTSLIRPVQRAGRIVERPFSADFITNIVERSPPSLGYASTDDVFW